MAASGEIRPRRIPLAVLPPYHGKLTEIRGHRGSDSLLNFAPALVTEAAAQSASADPASPGKTSHQLDDPVRITGFYVAALHGKAVIK